MANEQQVQADAAKAAEASKAAQETVKKDQEVLKGLEAEVKGKSEYETQEAYGRAFEEKEGEDSFRRASRLEREREAELSKGDPTRDPVAKQAAMDLNTPLPGAKADAEQIKKVGEDFVKNQSVAHKGVK